MRLLAISDIHNNIVCVRKLRSQEANNFDAVVVAGDFGKESATEIFSVLTTFACPVIYVRGNWDKPSPKEPPFDHRCRHVHLTWTKVGTFTFCGYSFPGTVPFPTSTAARYSAECREILKRKLARANVDFSRTIFLSHDRATHLARDFPHLLLHLFGHIHTFDVRKRGGTTYVNTSALDRLLPVIPLMATTIRLSEIRYANVGNYVVIEIDRRLAISVDCRLLRRSHQKWKLIDRNDPRVMHAGPLIPDDAIFAEAHQS